jgi:hypothetical protein
VTDHPTTRTDREPTAPPVDHPTGRLRRAWSAITHTTPTVDHPTDWVDHPTADWSALNGRRASLARWSDRAVQLTADYQPTTQPTGPRKTGTDRLRLVPPVAALSTAFVLQTIAVTDTVGEALTNTLTQSPMPWIATHASLGYLAALLLGIAVASCAEGGAAYLMDLYDKHLLARDSVWVLRLAMLGYVAVSAVAIHWWTTHRHLPEVTSWLLAGMSASALFLWSRGSRWRNRVAMRNAGQLDPALPKLPSAAKLWHPIRALNTIRLVSWEPVATTDEARTRYEEWRVARAGVKAGKVARKAGKPEAVDTDPVDPVDRADPTGPTDRSATDRPDRADRADHEPTTRPDQPHRKTAKPRPAEKPTTNRPPVGPALQVVGEPAAVGNARRLRERYGNDLPTSGRQIRSDTGWSKERVDRAVTEYLAGSDRQADDNPKEQVS